MIIHEDEKVPSLAIKCGVLYVDPDEIEEKLLAMDVHGYQGYDMSFIVNVHPYQSRPPNGIIVELVLEHDKDDDISNKELRETCDRFGFTPKQITLYNSMIGDDPNRIISQYIIIATTAPTDIAEQYNDACQEYDEEHNDHSDDIVMNFAKMLGIDPDEARGVIMDMVRDAQDGETLDDDSIVDPKRLIGEKSEPETVDTEEQSEDSSWDDDDCWI